MNDIAKTEATLSSWLFFSLLQRRNLTKMRKVAGNESKTGLEVSYRSPLYGNSHIPLGPQTVPVHHNRDTLPTTNFMMFSFLLYLPAHIIDTSTCCQWLHVSRCGLSTEYTVKIECELQTKNGVLSMSFNILTTLHVISQIRCNISVWSAVSVWVSKWFNSVMLAIQNTHTDFRLVFYLGLLNREIKHDLHDVYAKRQTSEWN